MERIMLIMLVGLPRSGKTAWAESKKYPIVNPDMIRKAMHEIKFYAFFEPLIWAITKIMIQALFFTGNNIVILDSTNTTKKRRDFFKNLSCHIEYKVFNISKEECIQKAKSDCRDDLIPIIEKMAKNYEPLGERDTLYEEKIIRPISKVK